MSIARGLTSGRVAVTGAAGFLGEVARQVYEENGFQVRGIDLPEPELQSAPLHDDPTPGEPWTDWRACDLSATPSENPFADCDAVLHLAASGDPGKSMDEIVGPNILGMHNCLCLAREAGTVKRVVFASTNHVNNGALMRGTNPGSINDGRLRGLGYASIRESDPQAPDSPYAVTKIFGEAYGKLATLRREFGFVALRIGWSSYYDSPADLHGSEDPEIQKNSEYLRAMWLSRRDAQGFFLAALRANLNEDTPFLVSYAVSKNGRRPFDLTTAIEELGYDPVDNAEDYFPS